MIGDAADIEHDHVLACDICIVGAGAAGIALALQFANGPENIIVLEGGGRHAEAASQALNRGRLAGILPHPPLDRFRRRAFGGATAIWGGRCVPFDPIDFASRPWMPGTPWPIDETALSPYYRSAATFCEIGEPAFTAQAAFRRGMRPTLAGFTPGHFTDTNIERFSCPTDFAARYGARLKAAPNILVLLHANATQIHTSLDGTLASAVSVASLRGRRFAVQARKIVLAAGGLETPRLMLASRDSHANGIGNTHDQVGRCYMTHLAGTIGRVLPDEHAPAPFHGYEISDDGVYCRRRFALTPDSQRALGCGNVIARLHHPRLSNPAHRSGALSAIYLAKPLIGFEYRTRLDPGSTGNLLQHIRNVTMDLPGAARFATHWFTRHTLAARKYPSLVIAPRAGPFSLDLHAEQAPNPDSRVRLGHTRDALGMQKIVVDWRCTNTDQHTLRVALAALAADFARSFCAKLLYDPEELDSMILREGAYGGHHIGTARMAASAHDGVVDADCRVFGMRNLYVAGSAVFPTSGQANPTFTIVALALRLADELRKEETFFSGEKNQKTFMSSPAQRS